MASLSIMFNTLCIMQHALFWVQYAIWSKCCCAHLGSRVDCTFAQIKLFEHTPLSNTHSYIETFVHVHCGAKCVACLHSFTHGMWATFECVPGSHFNAEEAIPLDTARHTNSSVQLDTAKKYYQRYYKRYGVCAGFAFQCCAACTRC